MSFLLRSTPSVAKVLLASSCRSTGSLSSMTSLSSSVSRTRMDLCELCGEGARMTKRRGGWRATQTASFSGKSTPESKPFEYYEILGISRSSRMSEVKDAYFRLAKQLHPDLMIRDELADQTTVEERRRKFAKITKAYTTLINSTQRRFYDQYGFSREELTKKGIPIGFEHAPTQYTEKEEEEVTTLVDWFRSQGHSIGEPSRMDLRQRMKNAYVELRWELRYHDWTEHIDFMKRVTFWAVAMALGIWMMKFFLRRTFEAQRQAESVSPIQASESSSKGMEES